MMAMKAPAIEMRDVTFGWDGTAQFVFDTQFPAGSLTAVMGPSGAGKSTLLALLAGFAEPLSGRMLINGEDIGNLPPHRRPVSMVFQDNNLFAHLTVRQNVGLGVHPGLKLDRAADAKIEAALDQTGLSGLGTRRPGALSGGQRQRVALARILVRDRPVLLLDEAFSSLGPGLRADMLRLCKALHDDRRLTSLMVTHEESDAELVADRLCFIDAGRVHADGTVGAMLDGQNADPAVVRYLKGDRL